MTKLETYNQQQQQLIKKQADERKEFTNFHRNVRQLVLERHKEEKRKARLTSEAQALVMHHQRELSELVYSETISRKLLHDQQKKEMDDFTHHYQLMSL